ncbi:MAG TPA: 3-deoxy-manno-octulosonate cytidylyltransferase [Pyrinomonadaceae bacterium]
MNRTGSQPPNSAVAIIPARFHSTRLPGKPLLDICGRPMIVRVCERAAAARNVGRVVVATDDRRIHEAVRAAGYEALLTSPAHASGSDRLAEAAAMLSERYDVIVNVQGDEPLIPARTIERAVDALAADPGAAVSTTSEPIEDAADVLSPDVVKVVADARGYALYFSRAPVPFPREAARRHGSLEAALANEPALVAGFRKHTGLYAYRHDFLLEYARLPQGRLEREESLEQLRILERGARIRVVEVEESSTGVDTEADLARVREIVGAEAGGRGLGVSKSSPLALTDL